MSWKKGDFQLWKFFVFCFRSLSFLKGFSYQLYCPQKLFPSLVVLYHVRQREVILLDVVTQFRIDLHQDWVSHQEEGTWGSNFLFWGLQPILEFHLLLWLISTHAAFSRYTRFSKFWQVKIVKPGLSFQLWGCQPSLDMSTTFANAFSQWPVFFCTLPCQIVSPGSSSQSAPEEQWPLSASQPPASRLPSAPPLLSPPKDIKLSFNFLQLWQFQL